MKLKFSFVDERKFEPCKHLGHFVFQVKKMEFGLSLLPSRCTVLCVTRQTPFGEVGGNLVQAVFMSVYCLLAANPIQKTNNPRDQHT